MTIENQYLLIAILSILLIVASLWYFKRLRNKCIELKWDNGKIRSKHYVNRNGEKTDEHRFYFRGGELNKILNWKNNIKQGSCSVYYNTGEKYIESFYENGKLEGDYSVFSKDGQILMQERYSAGIMVEENVKYKPLKENFDINSFPKDETLFNEYLNANFLLQKRKYAVVKTEQETKDSEKSKSGVISGLKKIGMMVSGVSAYKDRNSSKKIKEACDALFDSSHRNTEFARKKLNSNIIDFGNFRLKSLKNTTGKFLGMLKDMEQNNAVKEYEIMSSIGIDNKTVQQMKGIDMNTSAALKSSATVGALGAAAAMGTPTLVTGAVSALATASTGTAISSLGGAAATNATLAWLGGGSLASGGGGMAAGSAILSGITVGATAGIGVIAAGLIASTYYSKKLTEVKEYQKDVESKTQNMEKLWILMNGINERTRELYLVTLQLEERLASQLEYLAPLAVDFDTEIPFYNMTFQKTGLLAKSMSELAQTSLLDADGIASEPSKQIIVDTYKILNKDLANNG